MARFAILDGTLVLPCEEPLKWAEWLENSEDERVVAKTFYLGGIEVSTVFLGINYQFGDGPPLWFETMIFGGEHDQYQSRSGSWNEALLQHSNVCSMLETEGLIMAHLANGDIRYSDLWEDGEL